jgi:hypothetical protein
MLEAKLMISARESSIVEESKEPSKKLNHSMRRINLLLPDEAKINKILEPQLGQGINVNRHAWRAIAKLIILLWPWNKKDPRKIIKEFERNVHRSESSPAAPPEEKGKKRKLSFDSEGIEKKRRALERSTSCNAIKHNILYLNKLVKELNGSVPLEKEQSLFISGECKEQPMISISFIGWCFLSELVSLIQQQVTMENKERGIKKIIEAFNLTNFLKSGKPKDREERQDRRRFAHRYIIMFLGKWVGSMSRIYDKELSPLIVPLMPSPVDFPQKKQTKDVPCSTSVSGETSSPIKIEAVASASEPVLLPSPSLVALPVPTPMLSNPSLFNYLAETQELISWNLWVSSQYPMLSFYKEFDFYLYLQELKSLGDIMMNLDERLSALISYSNTHRHLFFGNSQPLPPSSLGNLNNVELEAKPASAVGEPVGVNSEWGRLSS